MKKLLLISALITVIPGISFARTAVSSNQSHKAQASKTNENQTAKMQVKQADKKQVMAKVQKYFNDLKTFEAMFVQVDRYGNVESGYLWIKRPNRVKMQYPKRVVLVNDNRVINYDKELKEKSETSVYSSPLSFFLDKKVNFQEKLEVIYASESDDAIFAKFCKKDEDAEGAVLLVFSKNPMELRKWIIFSDKNDESVGIEVSLFNWKTGENISDNIFDKY